MNAHGRALFVQMLVVIFMPSALSSVPTLIDTDSGALARWL